MSLGQRIKTERENKRVSQEKLAKAVGWNHHQIVSEVEQGRREVKAWELCEIAKFLSVSIDSLLEDKTPLERPLVLWRQKPKNDEKLLEARFLTDCENYLWVEQLVSASEESPTLVFENLPQKKIDLRKFTLDHAYRLAESARQFLMLGDFPATQLLGILEDRYGVKFIVDTQDIEPSAASSRSFKGCFVFMNGRHPEPRQYFSIAHELFHLLTWDEEMLALVDSDPQFHEKNEQLANAFAAGLLIPQDKLQNEVARLCVNRTICAPDIIAFAEQFQVSKEAMVYRMLNIGLISKKECSELKDLLLKSISPKNSPANVVYRLKSKFVRLVYLACEHVKISRAKAAKLLNVELCDLSDVFNEYGFVEING
jgi:Zn-dependent peptidase ImmA (M78 family)/DNA-binding XRE family transcriptional regulator